MMKKLAFESDFRTLITRLRKKYPVAFNEYNSFDFFDESLPLCFFEFIEANKLGLTYKLTEPFNLNFTGTYSYKIEIDRPSCRLLNRKSSKFSYYGIKSEFSA